MATSSKTVTCLQSSPLGSVTVTVPALVPVTVMVDATGLEREAVRLEATTLLLETSPDEETTVVTRS